MVSLGIIGLLVLFAFFVWIIRITWKFSKSIFVRVFVAGVILFLVYLILASACIVTMPGQVGLSQYLEKLGRIFAKSLPKNVIFGAVVFVIVWFIQNMKKSNK